MKVVFNTFSADNPIPVNDYISNRKMAKYYNREAQAALVTIKMLLGDIKPEPTTPIFYAVGLIEREEYDINKIAASSKDENGLFSDEIFLKNGMAQISPITQFKILYNMTLCFISIEYGFTGDNAVIYASANGLINNAAYSISDGNIIIGTGKIYADGSVKSGFALTTKQEMQTVPLFDTDLEAIELFKFLKETY